MMGAAIPNEGQNRCQNGSDQRYEGYPEGVSRQLSILLRFPPVSVTTFKHPRGGEEHPRRIGIEETCLAPLLCQKRPKARGNVFSKVGVVPYASVAGEGAFHGGEYLGRERPRLELCAFFLRHGKSEPTRALLGEVPFHEMTFQTALLWKRGVTDGHAKILLGTAA